MKIGFLTLVLIPFTIICAHGQELLDLQSLGTSADDRIDHFVTDSDGNSYIKGRGSGEFISTDSVIADPTSGNTYTFILKLNNSNETEWFTAFDYEETPPETGRIAVGEDGSVYVIDRFLGTVDIGDDTFSWPGTFGFVTYKLNSDGQPEWALQAGGNQIDFHNEGYIEILGYNTADGTVDGEEITNWLGSVAKLDLDGNLLNHFHIDNEAEEEVICGKDKDGNYYGIRGFVSSYLDPTMNLELFKVDETGSELLSRDLGTCPSDAFTTYPLTHGRFFTEDPLTGNHYLINPLNDSIPGDDASEYPFAATFLTKTDSAFNVISNQRLSERGAGYQGGMLSFLNGNLFLTASAGVANPNSLTALGPGFGLGLSQYQMIVACFSKHLEPLWFHEIPSIEQVQRLEPARVRQGNIIIGGRANPFEWQGFSHGLDQSNQNDFFFLEFNNFYTGKYFIEGHVFFDRNGNGVKDDDDPGISYEPIVNDQLENLTYYSDAVGDFKVLGVEGQQTLIIDELSAFWEYTTPDSIVLETTSTGSSPTGLGFGMRPIPGITELQVELIPNSNPQLGFEVDFVIEVCNNADTSSGIVKFVPDEIYELSSSDPVPNYFDGDTVFFEFEELLPEECITFNLSESVLVDVSMIGELAHSYVEVVTTEPDSLPENNHDFVVQDITGSYDPNDITVYPSCGVTEEWIESGKFLEYLIRFQNTGNDTAQFVKLRDTLVENLDLETFEILSSSHNAEVELNGNELVVNFDNILLPDSASDPSGSQGYFKYRIRPQPYLIQGQLIENTARIYFDYNPPIITNTTQTEIVDISDLVDITIDSTPCQFGKVIIDSSCLPGLAKMKLNDGDFETLTDTLVVYQNGYHSLTIAAGVDTLVFNSILINSTYIEATEDLTICYGDSALVGQTYQSTPGSYSEYIQPPSGCDSLIQININTIEVDTSITLTGDTLHTHEESPNVNYQWVDCSTNELIEGETSGTFLPQDTGLFALQLELENCIFMSGCYKVDSLSSSANSVQLPVVLYPNPTTGKVLIDLGTTYNLVNLSITNAEGRLIDEWIYYETDRIEVDIRRSPGTYFLKLTSSNKKLATLKVIKE